MKIIISSEHAKNSIPVKYRELFLQHTKLLASHCGYDIGILALAKALAKNADFFIYGKYSRLLIDLNRSQTNRHLFSKITAPLDNNIKQSILHNYYLPYHQQLKAVLDKIGKRHKIIHISCHSFTPSLHGKKRSADIGLLYDSSRIKEKQFCLLWQHEIQHLNKQLQIRRNYPYRGASDGTTSMLRKRYSKNCYLGIELEVKQGLLQDANSKNNLAHILQTSLHKALLSLGD